jgi:hypothetical protein
MRPDNHAANINVCYGLRDTANSGCCFKKKMGVGFGELALACIM